MMNKIPKFNLINIILLIVIIIEIFYFLAIKMRFLKSILTIYIHMKEIK